MPRAHKQVPTIYFGTPGKLQSLPWPLGGIEKTPERQTYDFLTGSGLHQVSSLTASSRPYVLSWTALGAETWIKLEQYRIGANGPGPFALIDPSAFNLLPANVASATALYRDATDLVTNTDGGTAGSNSTSTFIHRTAGDRSIRWQMGPSVIATNPALSVRSPFRNWIGLPVMTGLSYVFSSWMRVDGTVETSGTVSMRLGWYDSAGAFLSESSGGDVAVTSTWVRLSVTATAPANAAFVIPRWYATGSSLAVNGAFYIDEPVLEQDTVVNDWAPGTGIRPVQVINLTETVSFESRMRTNVQMTVRELAR